LDAFAARRNPEQDSVAMNSAVGVALIGLLLVALVCNELLKPVNEKWYEPSASGEPAKALQGSQR